MSGQAVYQLDHDPWRVSQKLACINPSDLHQMPSTGASDCCSLNRSSEENGRGCGHGSGRPSDNATTRQIRPHESCDPEVELQARLSNIAINDTGASTMAKSHAETKPERNVSTMGQTTSNSTAVKNSHIPSQRGRQTMAGLYSRLKRQRLRDQRHGIAHCRHSACHRQTRSMPPFSKRAVCKSRTPAERAIQTLAAKLTRGKRRRV